MTDAIQQRRIELDDAIAYAKPQEKDVYEHLRSIIGDNGSIIEDYDLLFEHNELRSNKQFALNFLKKYPRGYKYLSQDLKNDMDILLAIAKAPIFYDKRKYPSSDELRAICPLEEIVNEHRRKKNRKLGELRELMKKSPFLGKNEETINNIIKELTNIGLSFVKKENGDKYTIDFQKGVILEEINEDRYIIDLQMAIILEAIKSELDSYEYIKMMENKNNTCGYSGLDLQEIIRRGDKVDFEAFNDLLSMQYASEKLKNDKEFRKEVEGIAQSYIRNSQNNSTQSKKGEDGR